MSIEAKILSDSVSQSGNRLTTFLCTYPRIIHSQVLTHRLLSRNSASSRALPVKKQIEFIRENPYIPSVFGKNIAGMQSAEEAENQDECRMIWKESLNSALECADRLSDLEVHKQWASRILEPYAHISTIISATDWDNFFKLRCDDAAQPEFQELACLMRDLIKESKPEKVQDYYWHLPLVDKGEKLAIRKVDSTLDKYQVGLKLAYLSAARCTRVSYIRHLEKRSMEQEIEFCERLIKDQHLSGLEHAAMALPDGKRVGNFVGWKQFRKFNE